MFFTYVFRELRRRHRQALLTAMGLAVGVALVVAVTAYAAGVGKAQDQVLQSLYGVGTDITVSQQQKMDQSGTQQFGMQPPDQSKQGQKFSRSRVMTSPGQQSISAKKLAQIASLDGVDSATGSITMMRDERGREVRAGAGRLDRRGAVGERPVLLGRLFLPGPDADGAHQRLAALGLRCGHDEPQSRAPELGADQLGTRAHE